MIRPKAVNIIPLPDYCVLVTFNNVEHIYEGETSVGTQINVSNIAENLIGAE